MKNNILGWLSIVSLLLLSSCEDEASISAEASVPGIEIETRTESLERTYTSIKIKGESKSIEDQEVVDKGLRWGTSPSLDSYDVVELDFWTVFETEITGLEANTDYYFMAYITTKTGTIYSEVEMFSTLSLEGTSWEFTTNYPNDFSLYSKVDLLDDYTTVYDELDLPLHCPGCFVTYGTWTLDGNDITYIWEGSESENSTYTFHGTLSGMEMTGTYEHATFPDGTWSAVVYE